MKEIGIIALMVALVLGLSAGIADAGLRGHWKLDGNANDSSGHGNHGTVSGSGYVWYTNRAIGSHSLKMNGGGNWGLNNFVSIPNESHFDITGSMTTAAWIWMWSYESNYSGIVTKGDSAWRLHRHGSSSTDINFTADGPGYLNSSGVDAIEPAWHHVVGVYDQPAGKLRTYVDGVLRGEKNASGSIATNNHPVYLGNNAQVPNRRYNGMIDDVGIWNNVLSVTAINYIKNNGIPASVSTSAQANGSYAYSAGTLSVNASSGGSIGNIGIVSYQWKNVDNSVISGAANPAVSLAQSGLDHPGSSGNFTLAVTDEYSQSASDTAVVSYTNTPVDVVSASGVAGIDDSIYFSAGVVDPDLAANAEVTGFEVVDWEFSLSPTYGSGFLVDDGNIPLGDDLTPDTLRYIFGDNGIYTVYANAQDDFGTTDSLEFQFELVPEPATMLLLLGGGLFALLRRKR